MLSKLLGLPSATSRNTNTSAVVTLLKLSYAVGEVVQGQVTITVGGPEPFTCESATIALVGVEQLKWQYEVNDSWEDRAATHRFMIQSIQLPITPQTPLAVGQHVFPFVFTLPTNIPASFIKAERRDLWWGNVEAGVTYIVQMDMSTKDSKTPQIAFTPLTVHAVTISPVPPRQPVSETMSTRVKFFCCFEKGTCEISAGLAFDKHDLYTGVLDVNATVLNGTTLTIQGLVFTLQRVLELHVPPGYGHSGNHRMVSLLRTERSNVVIAPGTKKEAIPMQFTMASIMACFAPGAPLVPGNAASPLSPPMRPTERLLFTSISYNIEVKVLFASSMCSEAKLEVPVSLLHLPPAGWTPPPALPATQVVPNTASLPVPNASG